MDVSSILKQFDAEMRIDPPLEKGLRIEIAGGIVRVISDEACIIYSNLSEASMDRAIAEEAKYFASQEQKLEWKVYGHDQPHDLSIRLAAQGFEADEPETLMAFDLRQALPSAGRPVDVAIRRVHDEAGLCDLIAIQTVVFGRDHHRMADQFRSRLADPTLGLYVAYSGGVPAAAGRLSLPPGRSFAGLWGGATLPAFRKQGIYRALVAERASAARAQGYPYLLVEARATSRPILEQLGFVPLTAVVGWILRRPPAPATTV